MPTRPISSEFQQAEEEERQAELLERISQLEATVESLTEVFQVRVGGTVTIQATSLTLDSSVFSVNAPMAQFLGVVQCDTLTATTVSGAVYTPGAGNIM